MRKLRGEDDERLRIQRTNPVIPLFVDSLTHSSVPLADRVAVARSGGQGRP